MVAISKWLPNDVIHSRELSMNTLRYLSLDSPIADAAARGQASLTRSLQPKIDLSGMGFLCQMWAVLCQIVV